MGTSFKCYLLGYFFLNPFYFYIYVCTPVGCAGVIFGQPMDTVKVTMLQQQKAGGCGQQAAGRGQGWAGQWHQAGGMGQ